MSTALGRLREEDSTEENEGGELHYELLREEHCTREIEGKAQH